MTLITSDIVDCVDFKIILRLAWDSSSMVFEDVLMSENLTVKPDEWCFLVCKSSDLSISVDDSSSNVLYGTVGESSHVDHIEKPCLGILLDCTLDPKIALSRFVLACGLSVIEKANLELGDTVVVAGANSLALSVLDAANQQGARTVCIIPASIGDENFQPSVELPAELSILFSFHPSFDTQLDSFLALSKGKYVFVDTVGIPDLIHPMTSRLEKFSTLVLCRQDSNALFQVDIRRMIHINSAKVAYWTRPENLVGGLALRKCYLRASRMLEWKRVDLNFRG